MNTASLEKYISNIPDFPKTGVLFRDITPLLADYEAFESAVKGLVEPFKNAGVTKVLGVESRGFLLAAPAAIELKAGLALVRKKGKLPRKTVSASYELEYGTDVLEMHADALAKDEKVLILDDVLATGGTCAAVVEMARGLGARIAGISFLIELKAFGGRKKLQGMDVRSLIKY